MADLATLEHELIRALDEQLQGRPWGTALLAFAESERAAKAYEVDSALVLDQFEKDRRIEWLLEVHGLPDPTRRHPRARALKSAMSKAALDVRRRERRARDPLYAHLESKYRRLASPQHGLWIKHSIVGREGVDAPSSTRGRRSDVDLGRLTIPPMPRHVTARFVSRNDEAHATFIRECVRDAGGPLAHRQIVRLFLDAHGEAKPLNGRTVDVDALDLAGHDDADGASWENPR